MDSARVVATEGDVVATEGDVADLYKDEAVAEEYVSQRFQWSWNRLLHKHQVSVVDKTIRHHNVALVLEVAPGPARLAVDLENVQRGVMVDFSAEMLQVASRRLEEAGKLSAWTVREANAFNLLEHTKERFQLVFSFRFIRHFKLPDRARIYQSIHSTLDEGGHLIFDVVGKRMRNRIESRITPDQISQMKGRLSVYDVRYEEGEFRSEMADHGFEVVSMKPVVKHYFWQTMLSHRLDHRLPRLAQCLVNAVESLPSSRPLEWIAVCKKA